MIIFLFFVSFYPKQVTESQREKFCRQTLTWFTTGSGWAAGSLPGEPSAHSRMRAAQPGCPRCCSAPSLPGGNCWREHLGCSTPFPPSGCATGSAIAEAQLNPSFRQKSLFPWLSAHISLSLPWSYLQISPWFHRWRHPYWQYLQEDLSREPVAEVSLAIKICAGVEAFVISIHGMS